MPSSIRNAFVLGAGLGTRLNGLTTRKPKPLIPVCGKPLITFAFDHLLRNGITNLVVNTHHCPEAYAQAFADGSYHGVRIHFAHEIDLLETAGGIKNVESLLGGEPFIVYNGDILTDLPIEHAMQHHLATGNEVTLVLRSNAEPLHVSLDEATGRVVDIAQRLQSASLPKHLFTGIYVVSPEFFARIPAVTKISVIPVFLDMIRLGENLGGIVLDDGHWWDLGSREKYLEVHRHLKNIPYTAFRTAHWVDPMARIAASAHISGATAIGPGTVVGEQAALSDCVVWENAEIASHSSLQNCIVTAGQRVSGTHFNLDF